MVNPVMDYSGIWVIFIAMLVFFGLLIWMVVAGLRRLRRRPVLGAVLACAGLAMAFGPFVADRINTARVTGAVAATTVLPETLDFTGQRVLFVNTANTSCHYLCRVVIELGVDVEAYGVDLEVPRDDGPEPGPWRFAELAGGPENVSQVVLRDPIHEGRPYWAGSLPDTQDVPLALADLTAFDVVVVNDGGGILQRHLPEMLGDAVPDGMRAGEVNAVYVGWSEPFTTPAPAPTYLSIGGNMVWRPGFPWAIFPQAPMPYQPGASEAQWHSAVCATAPDPSDRTARAFAVYCK